ncbi:MAG: hypothetical protein EHM81_05935 [Chloroflexi bacterium]|nr:MAG: hypothetical protein EHM81_05935 [Chloroflexota bacterium]
MKKEVGLWIDHKKAVIVKVAKEGEEIKKIESTVDKQTRYSGRSGSKTLAAPLAEDHRDKKIAEHRNRYYDEIIAFLHDAESILILGPGEAKIELEKRLAHGELKRHIAKIEAVDKLTEPQLVAKVRQYFLKQHAHTP